MTKYRNESMEVVTVNLPKAYLAYIKAICDKDNAKDELGFEPSRSEFVRHAIKDKILQDLRLSTYFYTLKRKSMGLKEKLTIRVPHVGKISKKMPLGNDYYCKGMNEE